MKMYTKDKRGLRLGSHSSTFFTFPYSYHHKGQAAMEFLMTYGWAILVVLAAIAALAYFGVLSPSKFLPEKCLMETGFTCVSSKIEPARATLILSNGLGKPITIYGINISTANGDCATVFAGQDVSAGEQTTIAWSGCSNGNRGDVFKGNIQVYYTEKNPGGLWINKTAVGEIAVKVQ
jgi:hypothetical protein